EPGDRTFYLQVRQDDQILSVLLEKQQVQILAERIGALLAEVHRRFGAQLPPEDMRGEDLDPHQSPVDAGFRVGRTGLGWEAGAGAVVVELLAVTDTPLDESVVLDDCEEGPDTVRVFLDPTQARKFSARTELIIE